MMHTSLADARCEQCGWLIEVYVPHECRWRDKSEQEEEDDLAFRAELLQNRKEGS